MKNGHLYKLLFDHMLNGFAHCEIVYSDGEAVDWRYLVVNPAFEIQTGLKNVVGKLASEVIPGIHAQDPEILAIYANVAETLVSNCLERYVASLQQWYSVTVFSHQRGTFTAVFDVITHRVKMEQALQQKHLSLEQAYDETMAGWAIALELRDHETKGHSERVVGLTIRLAKELGIAGEELKHIQRGAFLHDVGKMGIPDNLLLKKGVFDDREMTIMKGHVIIGYEMLKRIDLLKGSLDVILYHHEKWNGSGYPHGLMGSEIPLAARIFSVVDVYDALTTDRPYREAMTQESALQHIKAQSGIEFDPAIVKTFIKLWPNGKHLEVK